MADGADRSGLQRRLRNLGVLPCAAASLLLCAWFTWDRLSLLDETFDANGQALARSVAAASDLGLFAGDRETLERIGQGTLKEPAVAMVEIAGRSGAPVQVGRRPERSREYVTAVRVRPLRALADFTAGTDDGRDQIGTVRVVMDTTGLAGRKHGTAAIGAAIAAFTVLLAAVFATRLARRVTVPLAQLSQTVEDIRAGHLEARAPVSTADELGRLATGVNTMAETLGQHRRDLEARVVEATRQAMARLKEAESASAAKARFLAAASHDLRQPLHALGFFVASLRAGASHEQQPLIGKIDEGLSSISSLLNALLDISRLDAEVLTPTRTSVPVQLLFDKLGSVTQPLADQQKVTLRIRPSALHVDTDAVLIGRILGNLINNALQYTPSGTVLVVARKRRNGRVRIEVRDSGIGIAPLHQSRVFDEFFQIDNPERDRRKGLGLGLSICQRLATLLGSRIELRSALGRGSVFALELPLAAPRIAAVPREAAVAAPAAPQTGLTLRGLLVDDDLLIRDATAALLAQWGCQIVCASTATEAIHALEGTEWPFDFVLSDLQLERIDDGWQVIEHARIRSSSTRLLLISGNTARETFLGAKGRGITLLTKPVSPARLRAALAWRPEPMSA